MTTSSAKASKGDDLPNAESTDFQRDRAGESRDPAGYTFAGMSTRPTILDPFARALDPAGRPDRLLRAGLWGMTGVVVALAIRDLLAGYPIGVDAEIPLRAADRWLAGGEPYLASSFQAPAGPDLPFLYPPFLLPFLGPLALLPRVAAIVGWMLVGVAAAAWTCRRLGIPWHWVPLILLWPPFFEGLIGGNIQVLLFAAFVALMLDAPLADRPFHPVERDLAASSRPAWVDGLLAVVNGAIKPSQAQPWLVVARRRPVAALLGAGIAIALIVATLPITGWSIWFDWLAQLSRAADPSWAFRGAGLAASLPPIVGLSLAAATMVAAMALPQRFAAAWLGILMIVGNPSLRMFGLLTLLPGMLTIRREIGLVAALCIASYSFQGIWLGVLVVALALAGGTNYPVWLEQRPAGAGES